MPSTVEIEERGNQPSKKLWLRRRHYLSMTSSRLKVIDLDALATIINYVFFWKEQTCNWNWESLSLDLNERVEVPGKIESESVVVLSSWVTILRFVVLGRRNPRNGRHVSFSKLLHLAQGFRREMYRPFKPLPLPTVPFKLIVGLSFQKQTEIGPIICSYWSSWTRRPSESQDLNFLVSPLLLPSSSRPILAGG